MSSAIRPDFRTCSEHELIVYHRRADLAPEGAFHTYPLEQEDGKWVQYGYGRTSKAPLSKHEWVPFRAVGGFYAPFGNLPCRTPETSFPFSDTDQAHFQVQVQRRGMSYLPISSFCTGLHDLAKSIQMLYQLVILNQQTLIECKEDRSPEEHFHVYQYTWHTQGELGPLQRAVIALNCLALFVRSLFETGQVGFVFYPIDVIADRVWTWDE